MTFERPIDVLGDGQHLFSIASPGMVDDGWWGSTSTRQPWIQQFVPKPMASNHSIPVVGMNHKTFRNPRYCPLISGMKKLEEVSIQILDEKQRPVQFRGGKTIVILSLRKQKD